VPARFAGLALRIQYQAVQTIDRAERHALGRRLCVDISMSEYNKETASF
jgi:hypothetical protein